MGWMSSLSSSTTHKRCNPMAPKAKYHPRNSRKNCVSVSVVLDNWLLTTFVVVTTACQDVGLENGQQASSIPRSTHDRSTLTRYLITCRDLVSWLISAFLPIRCRCPFPVLLGVIEYINLYSPLTRFLGSFFAWTLICQAALNICTIVAWIAHYKASTNNT